MKKSTFAIFAAATGLAAGAVLAQTESWRAEADVTKQDRTLTVTMIDRTCTSNGYLVTGKADLFVPVIPAPVADSKLRSIKSAYESTIGPVENKMSQSVIGQLTDTEVRERIHNSKTAILDSDATATISASRHEMDEAMAAFSDKLINILGQNITGRPTYSESSFAISEHPAPQCRVP